MNTVVDLLNNARSLIGTAENPLGSNRTRIGAEFGWNGVPWCAEFVSVCATRSGFVWMHTASAAQIIYWAKQGYNGLTWHTNGPRAGDIPVFGGGDHAGIIEYVGSGWVTEIDGNWNDRVMRRQQSLYDSWITGFARLPFAIVPPPPPPPPPPPQIGVPMSATVPRPNGGVERFDVRPDGSVTHSWPDSKAKGGWTPERLLSTAGALDPAHGISGALNPTGTKGPHMELNGTDPHGHRVHCWQTFEAPTGWSGWQSLP